MEKTLKCERVVYGDVLRTVYKAIDSMGIEKLYNVDGDCKDNIVHCVEVGDAYERYSSYLVDVRIPDDGSISELIVKDLMKTMSNDFEERMMNNVVVSNILIENENVSRMIMDSVEKGYEENHKKHYLYFINSGMDSIIETTKMNLYNRLIKLSIDISINQNNVNLLLDKVYEDLNVEFTDFERTLISNTVKGDLMKIPEAICDLINKRPLNVTIEEYNILVEKAYKYDKLINELKICM